MLIVPGMSSVADILSSATSAVAIDMFLAFITLAAPTSPSTEASTKAPKLRPPALAIIRAFSAAFSVAVPSSLRSISPGSCRPNWTESTVPPDLLTHLSITAPRRYKSVILISIVELAV